MGKFIYMKSAILFSAVFLFASAGLFSQNLSLDQAIQSSVKTIESRLPKETKVAVLAFNTNNQNFSNYIIDELATAISANNKIKVIERQNTDIIRKELNIQMSGDVSDDEIKRIGIQLGAQFVITGSLTDIGNAYRFRVFAINVETAVREASPSLNININDPQVVFLLTGIRKAQPDPSPLPRPLPSYNSSASLEPLAWVVTAAGFITMVVGCFSPMFINNPFKKGDGLGVFLGLTLGGTFVFCGGLGWSLSY